MTYGLYKLNGKKKKKEAEPQDRFELVDEVGASSRRMAVWHFEARHPLRPYMRDEIAPRKDPTAPLEHVQVLDQGWYGAWKVRQLKD